MLEIIHQLRDILFVERGVCPKGTNTPLHKKDVSYDIRILDRLPDALPVPRLTLRSDTTLHRWAMQVPLLRVGEGSLAMTSSKLLYIDPQTIHGSKSKEIPVCLVNV